MMSATALVISTLSLVVSVCGWFVVNWQAKRRDKTGCKRAFLIFVKQWRAEVFARVPSPSGDRSQDHCIFAYRARIPSFRGKIELVQDVFADRPEFDALTKRLADLQEDDWKDKPACDVILESMDGLIRFANSK